MDNNLLVISALGKDRPGIVDKLSKAALDSGCNIMDSRMTVLGGEFAVIMLLEGSEQAIKTLESGKESLADALELTIIAKGTTARGSQQEALPYQVEVVALDNPGIVHELSRFFSERNINIEAMETGTYKAPHTGSPMFSLKMTVKLPSSSNISELKEHFLEFCDERNLDATMES